MQDEGDAEPRVAETMRTGYRLKGRVVRPAMVHVTRARSDAVAPQQPQREWFEKDYYAVLGVASDASDKDVARAYRKLAKQYHPDANAGDKDAEDRFKEISAAHDVLGDAEKRKEYDQVREMVASGVGPGGFGSPFGGPGGNYQNVRFEDVGDMGGLGDLLGNLFGGRGGRGQRGADQSARSAAKTSRPSSISTSSTRCTA